MKAKLHKQILAKLSKIVDKRTLQQLEIITIAIMSMTGRVTMLGISRWSDKYSYKTIERFFDKKIDWLEIKWGLIKRKIADKEIILIADETTISKAGKSTYGLGYFRSSKASCNSSG